MVRVFAAQLLLSDSQLLSEPVKFRVGLNLVILASSKLFYFCLHVLDFGLLCSQGVIESFDFLVKDGQFVLVFSDLLELLNVFLCLLLGWGSVAAFLKNCVEPLDLHRQHRQSLFILI
jgi:hypothetical protein